MTTEPHTEMPSERMWCLACGTVTRDQHCDCTRMDTGTANFVNYADRLFEISRQAITEAAQLRTSHDALVAALREAQKQIDAVDPAVEHLAHDQEQCDMDGVMVKVSRQALDEVLGSIECLNSIARAALSSIGGGKS